MVRQSQGLELKELKELKEQLAADPEERQVAAAKHSSEAEQKQHEEIVAALFRELEATQHTLKVTKSLPMAVLQCQNSSLNVPALPNMPAHKCKRSGGSTSILPVSCTPACAGPLHRGRSCLIPLKTCLMPAGEGGEHGKSARRAC